MCSYYAIAYCCGPKCNSDGKRNVPGTSFNESASDSEAKAAWVRAIARKDWMPNTTSHYLVALISRFLRC